MRPLVPRPKRSTCVPLQIYVCDYTTIGLQLCFDRWFINSIILICIITHSVLYVNL